LLSLIEYLQHRDLESFPTRRSSDLNQETIVKVSSAKTSSKDLDIQDLVIILVKGYDTEKILMENMNIIGDNTVVMTLQNGIGNVDRKSTRLNSSHVSISYAVFCLKK